MITMTITCKCGQERTTTSFYSEAATVGWCRISVYEGGFHYICPNCSPKVKEAAKLIAEYSNSAAALGSILRW